MINFVTEQRIIDYINGEYGGRFCRIVKSSDWFKGILLDKRDGLRLTKRQRAALVNAYRVFDGNCALAED